jgi:hypothetical protein
MNVARFMPYYSVIDGYRKDGYFSKAPPPVSALNAVKNFSPQVRNMKGCIRDAFHMDPVKKHDILQDIEHRLDQDLQGRASRLRTQIKLWIPPFVGMHG